MSYQAGGGEPGYIAPDPLDPDIFYAGTNNGGYLDKYNRRTGYSREVNPYPWFYSGEPCEGDQGALAVDVPDHLLAGRSENALTSSSQRLWRTTRRRDAPGPR